MILPPELVQKYSVIELGIHIQRAVEILDDLNITDHPFKNKKLNQQLKGVYGVLDKETKLYNDLHEVSSDDLYHFYDVIKENSRLIMSNHLVDKSLVCSFLVAHEADPKAAEGIINKILRGKNDRN